MNIFFRADASDSIGTGHLMRCLVLADVLSKRGARCHFIVRQWNAVSRRVLEGASHAVTCLNLPDDAQASEDALCSLEIMRSSQGTVDWVVADHYALDAHWERTASLMARSLMVIDDLANRSHQCDVLVDPGLGRQASTYAQLLPEHAQLLLGSRYAILKPAFAELHASAPDWADVRLAHVFFGGGSSADWLPACVQALLDAEPTVHVFAVGICDEQAMHGLLAHHGQRLTWHRQEPDMALHYARCSVAVGSPGTATWERACIGLPSALMATAENQIPILEHLDAQGLCRYLGPAWNYDPAALTDTLRAFLRDNAARAAMRAVGIASVDGRGAERIAQRMCGLGAPDA